MASKSWKGVAVEIAAAAAVGAALAITEFVVKRGLNSTVLPPEKQPNQKKEALPRRGSF